MPSVNSVPAIGTSQLRGNTRHYLGEVATGSRFRLIRRGRVIAAMYPSHEQTPCACEIGHHGPVSTPVTVSDLRLSAGRFLDRVQSGETLEIFHDGKLLARIAQFPCPVE